jgi:hypothetical protein
MTARKAIKTRLRAAIFSGAVGLLPAVALADGATNPSGAAMPQQGVPDHAAAETRGPGEIANSSTGPAPIVPDHATAEARGAGDTTHASEATTPIVPDHAAAERRGAGDK